MGLLGDGWTDPQSAAVMNLAGGLLQGNFGAGLMGANAGYQDARIKNLQVQGMQTQNQLNQYQLERQQMMMGLLQGVMGNQGQSGQPSQPQPAQPSQPAIGATQGGPLGSGTFGIPTGGQAAASGQPQGQVQGQPQGAMVSPGASIFGKTPQQLYQQGFALSLAGIPTGAEMMKMAVQYDPSLQMQMPTDVAKNAAAAYGYGTPEYYAAIRGATDKAGTTPLRIGAPYIRNGQLYGTPGAAPAGYMNQPNPDGSWSIQQVTNGPQSVAASSAASAAGTGLGKLATTPQPSFNNATGQPGNALNPFGVQIPGLGQIGGTNANGSPNAFVASGPMQGSEQIANANATNYVNTQQAVPRVMNSMAGDKNALDLVNSGTFVTGNGSEKKYDWTSLAQTWHIPIAQGETANYQLAHKYLANSVSQTASDMGMNGSDARFAYNALGNPNMETQGPQALADSIRWVAGLKTGVPAYASAQQAWMQAHQNSPTSLSQFQQQWNKAYNPNVFVTRWLQQEYGTDAMNKWIAEHKLDPKQLSQNYMQLHSLGAF